MSNGTLVLSVGELVDALTKLMDGPGGQYIRVAHVYGETPGAYRGFAVLGVAHPLRYSPDGNPVLTLRLRKESER